MRTRSSSSATTVYPVTISPIMAMTQRAPVNMAKPLVNSPKRLMPDFSHHFGFWRLLKKSIMNSESLIKLE